MEVKNKKWLKYIGQSAVVLLLIRTGKYFELLPYV